MASTDSAKSAVAKSPGTNSPLSSTKKQRSPWLRHYPAGVPAHLDYPRQPLGWLLERAALQFPQRVACRYYSQQLTYDRQVLDSAISRVTGGGLRPDDIIKGMQGAQGPTELRYRAHVAFSTAYDLMKNLEKLQNRRKAVLYISSGYDFNPFETSRLKYQAEMIGSEVGDLQNDPFYRTQQQGTQFAEADLVRELSELTRAANRANATFYTIDPRGLVAGPDLDEQVETQEWQTYVRETQDSLRVLAEQTGGIAVVNQNDFDKALKRIDAETSDYYVLGYYSSNPDPLKRTRKIEVKAARDNVNVWSRTSYSLRPLPPPVQ